MPVKGRATGPLRRRGRQQSKTTGWVPQQDDRGTEPTSCTLSSRGEVCYGAQSAWTQDKRRRGSRRVTRQQDDRET